MRRAEARRWVRITGEVRRPAYVLPPSRGDGMGRRNLAEGIGGPSTGPKARTRSAGQETRVSVTAGDADGIAEMSDSRPEESGRNPRRSGTGASNVTTRREHSHPETERLMEAAVERGNMWAALGRVEANKGAATGCPWTD